jgi:hypothetical protein
VYARHAQDTSHAVTERARELAEREEKAGFTRLETYFSFDEKVKAGQQKAKELNARFADWYYVVGEDTYRKIHVGKSDIIKKKPKDTKDGKDSATTPPANPFNLNALPGGKK